MSSLTLASLDVDKLISDIAIRPAIWDRNFNSRQNKSFLEDTWEELAEIHNTPSKTLKAKWKSLRDNFRIQWKMIPRCENDELLISPEDFTGTKWQYYKQLLFLAKNMVKTRTNNSYNQSTIDDDRNYDLFQLFGSSNDMPSLSKAEVETKYDRKSSIALYQQQLQQNHQEQELFKQLQKKLPKLEETSKQKIVDVNQLTDKTITQTQINTIPVVHSKKYYHQQSSSFNHKRRRLDEVTTTNDEKSSNIPSTLEYPTASSINLPNSSNDDDYYFIMSLQPYLHQFSGPQKLKVQMGIQKLVFQELYKHDIDDD